MSPTQINRTIALFFLMLVPFLLSAEEPAANNETTSSKIALEKINITDEGPDLEAARVEANLTPGAVSIIEIDDLRERNVSSIADLFRFVPGVWAVSSSGTDEIFFSSRGSNLDSTSWDMNGIKLLQDGLPVTSADGNNHNRIIDPLAAKYATVARGANALKYGASTLGGAVNFATPTAHNSPTARLFLNGGTYGHLLGRGTFSHVFNDTVDALVTIEGKQWEGFRDHSEQQRFGTYGNVGFQLGDSISTRFYATYIDNETDLPSSLTRAQFNRDPDQASPQALSGDYKRNVETWRVANKTSWTIDDSSRLELGLSYEEQQLFHPIVAPIVIPIGNFGGAPFEVFSLLADNRQRDFGAMARYHKTIGDHNLLFGFNYGSNTVKGEEHRNLKGHKNGVRHEVNNDASTLEAYVMDRWRFTDDWMVTLAVQGVVANREIRKRGRQGFVFPGPDGPGTFPTGNSNPSEEYQSINPRFGLTYFINPEISLFTNVSRLYEPPTTFQLEDNVANVNGGNDTLDAMQGTVVEVGTRGGLDFAKASQVDWELSLYYAWIKDEILSVEPFPGESLSTNIDRTKHAGIEGVVSAKLALEDSGSHAIHPTISFTVNDFEFDGDDVYGSKDLPAAPDFFVHGEALYRHVSGFYIGPTFDVVGKRYADFNNTYEIDSYYLIGARAGWSNEQWRVFIEGQNLLDDEYVVSHGVRETAAANANILNPGAPASLFVGVEFNYD